MAKSLVMALGVIMVILGVLGFFTNPVLGIFEVDSVQNIVHILTGVLGIAMASLGEASAKTFGKVFGVVYLLIALLGFVLGADGKLLGLMVINPSDNYLYVLLTVVFLYIGFSRSSASSGV